MNESPEVAVLLATFNGARWLPEQLASMARQQSVDIRVVASDDASTDATPALLRAHAASHALLVLPPAPLRFGNANRNFLRLVRDAPLGSASHVALADQDDIWLDDKCARAVDVLRSSGADACSSDVIAFWPDGRRHLVRKSQPQRAFDHLFESAGPGCTFVFTRAAFERLRAWVVANDARLQAAKVHDWLIYAHARHAGWHWVIDAHANVLYRQHAHNEIGAHVGAAAVKQRGLAVLSGRYRSDVLGIAHAIGDTSWVTEALERFALRDRLTLAFHARQLRRRARDACALAVLLLSMRRSAND